MTVIVTPPVVNTVVVQTSVAGGAGSGGYQTVQDEGSSLTQRGTLNFVGAGVTATDAGGKTVVTIPGGGGAGAGWPAVTVTSVSANTTLSAATHDVVLVDATGAARTIGLPAAAANAGALLTVKKIDSSTNAVTVDANASETIDGQLTVVLTDQWESVDLVCDGTAWFLI